METTKNVLLFLAAYLLGSLNLSIFISRELGSDVRRHGSGNAGATNMARIFGMGHGLLALGGDMLKAVAAMMLGLFLGGDWGLMAGGVGCLLGHCFPAFHHFKGGKGVSVGGIISLVVNWRVGAAVFATFLIAAFASKKVSLGSVLGAAAATVAALVFRVSTPRLILAAVATTLVIFQHRGNIVRLFRGTEPDFRAKEP